MNKKQLIIIILATITVSIQAQQKTISHIKNDGSWYLVYDDSGKKITTIFKNTVGKIIGWGADFFVSIDGSWYKVYDSQGKKITTLTKQSVGDIISVSSTSFTSQDGDWLKTYDKNGKKLSTKPAR